MFSFFSLINGFMDNHRIGYNIRAAIIWSFFEYIVGIFVSHFSWKANEEDYDNYIKQHKSNNLQI